MPAVPLRAGRNGVPRCLFVSMRTSWCIAWNCCTPGPHQKLAEQLIEDIASASPETTVNLHLVDPRDPWDFQEVYGKLHDFARHYAFDVEHERYLMHITTGTHVAQICIYLLTEARYFPAELLQSSPPRRQTTGIVGSYALIDLESLQV